MANHKRRRTRNQRAGCKMCKYWKVNGHRTERADGERFSDHRRRVVADEEIRLAPHRIREFARPRLGEGADMRVVSIKRMVGHLLERGVEANYVSALFTRSGTDIE